MNKKGFTLVEIIGAVIILGIIALFAFNTFTSNMRGFREDYYTSLIRTLDESGKEFFNDNRQYRPGGTLGAQKVSIGMLEAKGYVDEAKDYRGNVCNKNDSYVLVVKEGRDEYSYHTCLICQDDDYSNTDDMYCDPAWLDPTKVTYGIGDPPHVYVYLNTPRDILEKLLEVPVSYVRIDSDGRTIKSVRGTPEEGLETILPKDIDVVDTKKVGEYKVTYEFKRVKSGTQVLEEEISPGYVTVYENEMPGVAMMYENVEAKTGATLGQVNGGQTETNTGIYSPGTWAQKITITLAALELQDETATIARYQWNKDGRWQDFCDTGGTCQVTLQSDMNEDISFRTIDSNGHISKETTPVRIKRDDTLPYCVLSATGTPGTDGWFTSNVDLAFSDNRDLSGGTYAAAISGVLLNNLALSTATINRTTSSTTNQYTENTTGVTYIGYVEDNAHNFYTCEKNVKIDKVVPDVSVTVTRHDNNAQVATNTWVNSYLDYTFTAGTTGVSGYTIKYCQDTDNTCTPSTIATNGTKINNSTVGIYYIRYKIVSGAGLESEVGSFTAKVDIIPPTCSLAITAGTAGTSPWYKSASMTVTSYYDDEGGSLVNQKGTSDSGTATYNGETTYTLSTNENGKVIRCYVNDVAGNTGTNSITLYKDDVTPSVSVTATRHDNNAQVATETWVNSYLDYTFTAGTTGVSGYTIKYCQDTTNT